MDMRIKLDVNPMFREFTGEHAIPRAELDSMLPELKKAHAAVEAGRGKGMQGWMDLPYNQDEILTAIEKTAARVREEFEAFVVLGIGGSALGPAAVQQALNHLHYNELPAEKRGGPRLYIEDNVDPERMAALLDVIDLKKTCFNVITKSGGTAETMSQYLIVTDALKKAVGDDYKRPHHHHHLQEQGLPDQDRPAGGLRDLLHSRRRGRTLLRTVPGGPASPPPCTGIDIRAPASPAPKEMDRALRVRRRVCRTPRCWTPA